MKINIRNFVLAGLGIFIISRLTCYALNSSKPTQAEGDAVMTMIHVVNHTTFPFRATLVQQMLKEANYFAIRLQLPTSMPILKDSIQDGYTPLPWFCVLKDTNYTFFPATVYGREICNTNIPIELRLHALKFMVEGRIDTTNFEFGFQNGKLTHVMRLSAPMTEYYSRNLDKLVGKLSLIDSNGAYQLATQWLSAVDVDVPALEKNFSHSINQLSFQPNGTTNSVLLPLFYVGFGTNSNPKWKTVSYDPAVEVEILGTTKQLQNLIVNVSSFCHRPTMIISNALDLVRTPTQPIK